MALTALRYFDHPLARVAYVDSGAGTGPALVWVHGALCDHRDWQAQLKRFSATHRVLALDLPGHGQSPAGEAAIGIAPYARLLRDWCAALDVGEHVLVGHSMACRVLLQAAGGEGTAPPPGLLGLALVDGAYLAPGLLQDNSAAARAVLAAQARARAAQLYTDQAPAERAARGFGQMFFDARFDAERDRMIERARALPAQTARTLMPDFAAWDAEHLEAALARVRVPILAWLCTYMNHAHERVRLAAGTTTPWIQALKRHAPQARLERLEGCGHFPMIERPDAFDQCLRDWLGQLVRAPDAISTPKPNPISTPSPN